MNRFMVGLAAAGVAATVALAGAFAQEPSREGGLERGAGPVAWRHGPPSPEDRAAFLDARLAGLRAGLKLTAEQDRLWPPVEDAMRGMAQQRRNAQEAWRTQREANPPGDRETRDIPALLRTMADQQSARADALRKLADATSPLYASLDDGQKRRLAMLSRGMPFGFGGAHKHRGGPDGRHHGPHDGPHGRWDDRG